MSALDKTEEEMEKRNKILHEAHKQLSNQVQMLKEVLRKRKIDDSTVDSYKRSLSENEGNNLGSNLVSGHQFGLSESDANAAINSSAIRTVHSSTSQQTANQPVSQAINLTVSPVADQVANSIASPMAESFDIGNREKFQNEMMKMGPDYSSFDMLLAAAKNST